MQRLFGAWYALCLIAGLALLTLARINDGAVLLLSFEGDAVHMAQVVLRMVGGEVPGVDFLTPLGALAFLPIVWLEDTGFGIGAAFAYAPAMIGICLLPAIWWFGGTRLPRPGAYAFGASVLILLMSLLHGGDTATVTASMYYNNWCWAIASVVVLAALTKGQGDRLAVAVTIGVGMGALALIKAPFAVFLAPALVVSLALARRWVELLGGIGIALVFAAIVTGPLGLLGYWTGYVGDLLYVAGAEVRASPGQGLAAMAISPGHIAVLLAWLMSLVLLRQANQSMDALVLLVLGGGFFAITHQNWQNDPHWVVVFGLLLLVMRPDQTVLNRWGWSVQRALGAVAVAFFVVGAPPLYAQLQSLMVHSGLSAERFVPLLPNDPTLRVRAAEAKLKTVKTPHPGLGQSVDQTRFQGEVLPWCEKDAGLVEALQASAQSLAELADVTGKTAINADWVNGLWIWSDMEPLPGGMPWYYGGTAGIEAADFLVVPLCPMGLALRAMVLREIEGAGMTFAEVGRNELLILYERTR